MIIKLELTKRLQKWLDCWKIHSILFWFLFREKNVYTFVSYKCKNYFFQWLKNVFFDAVLVFRTSFLENIHLLSFYSFFFWNLLSLVSLYIIHILKIPEIDQNILITIVIQKVAQSLWCYTNNSTNGNEILCKFKAKDIH